MRILLADDNPMFSRALERFLRADSRIRQLHLARSGAEAIELVDREKPDLVLLDWALPDLRGLWAALRITGDAETSEVWLLAPTDNPEYERAARAAGAEGCLPRRNFSEKIEPILQNLQQRLGRRPPPSAGFLAGTKAQPGLSTNGPPPAATRESGGGGLPEGGSSGESRRPEAVLQAIRELEMFCAQHLDGLERIKEELAAPVSTPGRSGRRPGDLYLVCRIGTDCIGLKADQVARVEKTRVMTPLPPEYAPVSGLATFEGTAVPVISLLKVEQAGNGPERAEGRLVIIRSGRSLAGLKIDGIEDVIPVATSGQWPVPWHPTTGPRSYLTRVTRYKDRFIFLVDVDKIMTDLNGA